MYTSKGYLRVIIGPMYSGKSTLLLDIIRQFSKETVRNRFDSNFVNKQETNNKKFMVINHSSDTRYGKNVISTHNKQQYPCYSLSKLSEIEVSPEYNKIYKESKRIIIDESQFFDSKSLYQFVYESVIFLHKTVIVSGLSGDSNQQKFGGILDLLPLADKIDVLYATCSHCGEIAPFTKRIVNNTSKTLVGSVGTYEPVCRDHL